MSQEPCSICKGQQPLCIECHQQHLAEMRPRRKPPRIAKRDWQRPLNHGESK